MLANHKLCHREQLREEHAVAEEIADAITQSVGQNATDEMDLEEEFERLQEQELTNKMLDTGSVPVNDQVNKAPAVPATPGRSALYRMVARVSEANSTNSQITRRGRRRGRAQKIASGDGNVIPHLACSFRARCLFLNFS